MSPLPSTGDEPAHLDTVPPPPPVFHVEQALLGALLLDPHRRDDVTVLTTDSFSTAEHSALYAAVTTLPPPDPAEHAKNTTWPDRVLATAREQARGLTVSYLHALVQACPRLDHAATYARMIETAHARRRLQSAAESLVHTARDVSLPRPVQTVLAEADSLSAVVDAVAASVPTRSGAPPRTTTPPPPTTSNPAQAVEEEQILLATATTYPATIGAVAHWLLPDDLTLPLHAGLWHCLTTLAHRHDPIDRITVLWEAGQRGLMNGNSDPNSLLRMLAEPAGSVEHWAERTLQRSLLATAEHTGRRIAAYTEDPANTPFQLVIGARRALADISAIRTRWQHATGATPPQQRRPVPTTRARPPSTRAAHTARSTRTTR